MGPDPGHPARLPDPHRRVAGQPAPAPHLARRRAARRPPGRSSTLAPDGALAAPARRATAAASTRSISGRLPGVPCVSRTMPTPRAIHSTDSFSRVRSAQRSARNVPAGTVTSSSASTVYPGPASEGGALRPTSSGRGKRVLARPGAEADPTLARLHRPGAGIGAPRLVDEGQLAAAADLEPRRLVGDRVDPAHMLGVGLAVLPPRAGLEGEDEHHRRCEKRAHAWILEEVASGGPSYLNKLAERGGFEPPVQALVPYNRLAICPVRPLQHLSAREAPTERLAGAARPLG